MKFGPIFRGLWILGMLLLSLAVLTGCGVFNRRSLHIIEAQDIQRLKAGEVVTVARNGYFVSDEYLKEVMHAKVNP